MYDIMIHSYILKTDSNYDTKSTRINVAVFEIRAIMRANMHVLMNIKVRSISRAYILCMCIKHDRRARAARTRRAKMNAVPRRYCPSAEFPARFSQSTVGWKYSGRVSNYRRRAG